MSKLGLLPPQTQSHWVCPCGSEPPSPGKAPPVATIVSPLRRDCPFCGRTFKEEYRRAGVGPRRGD